MSIIKDPSSDPTTSATVETQTVTVSSGTASVTFAGSYDSTPTVVATAIHSVETGVTVDDDLSTTGCTILAENDQDVAVLIIGE